MGIQLPGDRSVVLQFRVPHVRSECPRNLFCPSILPVDSELGAGPVGITLPVTLAQHSLEIGVTALYTNHTGIRCCPRTSGFNTRRKYIPDSRYSARETTSEHLLRHLRGMYFHPASAENVS